MFVYEEKILKEYKIKVFEIVGWEGIWGMLFSLVFIIVFYLMPGDDYGCLENPIQATLQIANNPKILVAIMITTLVIGPFNYFGTSLTKFSSAMHRCLIDSSRMCIIWLIAVCCSWESFTLFQGIGYGFIMMGNLLYYEILNFDMFFICKMKNNKNIKANNNLESSSMILKYDKIDKKEDVEHEITADETLESRIFKNNDSTIGISLTEDSEKLETKSLIEQE